MTATPILDPALAWDEQIDRAEPDLLWHLLNPSSAVGGHVIMPNRLCDLQERLIGG